MIANMLFDHSKDSDENENVVNKPEYADAVTKLQHLLHTKFQNNIEGN